jgi:hypothetical protein
MAPRGNSNAHIMVCNRDRAIGVIELKFAPRGIPRKTRDHEKFKRLSAVRKLTVKRSRWNGDKPLKEFPGADDAVFMWAAIGRSHESIGARIATHQRTLSRIVLLNRVDL